jgi:outer membrane immunogenic protein
MNIQIRTIAAALLATGSLTCAAAAGWSGFYLGANAGAALGTSHATTTTVFSPTGYFATTSVPAIATTGAQHLSDTAFVGGLESGYNWRMDDFVLGFEVDFDYAPSSAHASGTTTYPCCSPTNFTITSSLKTSWMTTVRPRLGWAWGDEGLLYATGGFAAIKEKAGYVFTDTFATAASSGNASSVKTGWTVGAGMAYAIAPGWNAKVEYLYADFGKITFPGSTLTAFTPAISFPTSTFTHTSTLRQSIVRVGIDYEFN